MFGCLNPAKAWKREMTAPLKPMTIGKNCEGENDGKEYLDVTADRLAGCGDVYSV
jgi:hypothetical protein